MEYSLAALATLLNLLAFGLWGIFVASRRCKTVVTARTAMFGSVPDVGR